MVEQQIKTFEAFIKHGTYLRNWSPRTVRTYRQAWGSFTRFQAATNDGADGVSVPVVTKARLEAWVIWLRETGVSPGGCNMYIRTINSFLSWLKDEGHLPEKLKIRLLPNPSKPLRGFSETEIRSLLSFRPRNFTELRTWTLINTLLDTGVRIDEALTLGTAEIDYEALTIRVKGKGSKIRIVPVSLELRKTLYRFLQVRQKREIKHSIYFCTRSGHKLSYRNTYRDIKNLCAKAGVVGSHVHPHAFRHCFAVTYVRRGGDIYRLSRILGHTSISTTQLYLRSMGIEAISENHSVLSPLSQLR